MGTPRFITSLALVVPLVLPFVPALAAPARAQAPAARPDNYGSVEIYQTYPRATRATATV